MSDIFDIAIFGTSITTELNNRNWPEELRKYLQIGKRSAIRTYPVGKGSQNSSWGLANISRVTNLKPRAVLIEFVNDGHNLIGVPVIQSRANFETMIGAIRSASPITQIFLMSLVRPTAEYITTYYPNLPAYYAEWAAIAAENGLGFIDCYHAWGDPAVHPEETAPPADGVHPSIEAYKRVSIPVIASTIGPLIP